MKVVEWWIGRGWVTDLFALFMGRVLRKGWETRLGSGCYLLALAWSSDPHPIPSVLQGVCVREINPLPGILEAGRSKTAVGGKRLDLKAWGVSKIFRRKEVLTWVSCEDPIGFCIARKCTWANVLVWSIKAHRLTPFSFTHAWLRFHPSCLNILGGNKARKILFSACVCSSLCSSSRDTQNTDGA